MKMSNAFDALMSQSGNSDNDNEKPSTSGGRPMHEHWYGFEKIQVSGRVAAKCKFCSKTITNTAKARLLKHR